jgi:hypothetical protein
MELQVWHAAIRFLFPVTMNYRAASHAVSKDLQAWMRGKPRGIRPETE